jgi:hypothetical protein
MKYKDTSVATNPQPSAPSPQYDNWNRLGDTLTASLALIVIVGMVCLMAELSAKLILLAALVPWGLLAIGRLLVLFTITLEEFLKLLGHPRDLNQDGQLGFAPTFEVQDKEPWQ